MFTVLYCLNISGLVFKLKHEDFMLLLKFLIDFSFNGISFDCYSNYDSYTFIVFVLIFDCECDFDFYYVACFFNSNGGIMESFNYLREKCIWVKNNII